MYILSSLLIFNSLLMCHSAEIVEDILLSSVFTFSAFAIIFLFSELGERITNKTNEIYNDLMRCEWYKFPRVVQRTLPILISGTQTPIYLNGIGNIVRARVNGC